MSAMRRVLGTRISEFLIKKTIYDQFVAGNDRVEISEVVTELRRHGVGALLAMPMEDDAGGQSRLLYRLIMMFLNTMWAQGIGPAHVS